MADNKKNGVFYTPPILADYLVKPLSLKENQTILDPSYGEGALLLAAEREVNNKKPNAHLQLFGCDIQPVNGLLKHLPEANLNEVDFFSYSVENKFETLLMNPPYVRHHIQDSKKISLYKENLPDLNILNKSADLWAYFLIKAVSHLNANGNIGAIIPWSFLQADYAIPLRRLLVDKFEEITALAISHKYFEDADERVVMLWLKGYGKPNKSIRVAASKNIETEPVFYDIDQNNWCSDKVNYTGEASITNTLSLLESRYRFVKFMEYADVKIGVVTGAVKYFIRPKEELISLKINRSRRIPILTSAAQFHEYLKNGKDNLKELIAFKDKDHLKYKKLIKQGIEDEINLTSHSQLRSPWYVVKIGAVPDAFFHYRATKTPYLVLNDHKIQCTNSIHRIYFKSLTQTQKKWLIVSLLSNPSQLSIEMNAKTYGRSILKIEPTSLKKTLVVVRNDRIVEPVFRKIQALLADNKRDEAVKQASAFIYRVLNLPISVITTIESELNKIQDLRISHKTSKTTT